MRIRKLLQKIVIFLVMFVLLVLVLLPIVLTGINAFKTEKEYYRTSPFALPEQPTLESFRGALTNMKYFMRIKNSFLISIPTALIATVISLLNGYALGIGRVRGKIFFLLFFLIAMMLPVEALVYPIYYMFRLVKLYNTRLGVGLCLTAGFLSFGTYLLTTVLETFPRDFVDAAEIDGAGKIYVLTKIIVPLVMPTLSVLFVFLFIWSWNDFFLSLIFLISERIQTIPLGILHMSGQYRTTVTLQSAGAFLLSIPCIIFFLIFQRTLTKGIMASGLKG
jgi:raffinose/stachyose/melibiose transport system permease protein